MLTRARGDQRTDGKMI